MRGENQSTKKKTLDQSLIYFNYLPPIDSYTILFGKTFWLNQHIHISTLLLGLLMLAQNGEHSVMRNPPATHPVWELHRLEMTFHECPVSFIKSHCKKLVDHVWGNDVWDFLSTLLPLLFFN